MKNYKKSRFYKILDLLNWIYIISIFLIIILGMLASLYDCDTAGLDDWGIEHFEFQIYSCENYNLETSNYDLIFSFLKFQREFSFYFFEVSILSVIFFVFNFIYDSIYIKKQNLSFKNIFKRISFYGFSLNLLFLIYCFIMIFVERGFIFSFHF